MRRWRSCLPALRVQRRDVGNLLDVQLIEAVDVSNAIAWLVSDEARYVTAIALRSTPASPPNSQDLPDTHQRAPCLPPPAHRQMRSAGGRPAILSMADRRAWTEHPFSRALDDYLGRPPGRPERRVGANWRGCRAPGHRLICRSDVARSQAVLQHKDSKRSDRMSRWHASASPSCWRCGRVRVSSAPPLAGRAASTTATAAAAGPVRSPVSRPARRWWFPATPPVIKGALVTVGGRAGPLDHLLGQRPQSASSAPCSAAASRIAPASARRSSAADRPLTQGPGPRAAQLPRRQRGSDQRMRGQAPGPLHRRTSGPGGDAGEGPQPGRGPVLPIRLMALLGAERGQHLRPRRRVLRPGLLQPDQRLRLSGRAQLSGVTAGQVPQPGPHHGQRLHRARRRGRLTNSAHGRDHLPCGTGRASDLQLFDF